jgi:hypothetical protein
MPVQRSASLAALVLGSLALLFTGCGPHLGQRVSGEALGCGGLIVLILAIYAIVNIIGSSASTEKKVLWTLLVFFVPLLGFIIWALAGPRRS